MIWKYKQSEKNKTKRKIFYCCVLLRTIIIDFCYILNFILHQKLDGLVHHQIFWQLREPANCLTEHDTENQPAQCLQLFSCWGFMFTCQQRNNMMFPQTLENPSRTTCCILYHHRKTNKHEGWSMSMVWKVDINRGTALIKCLSLILMLFTYAWSQ